MALPKEPRQKMINMMYLVLTALLALNVSSEIINAFETVNNSILTSNKIIEEKTAVTYKSFEEKAKDPQTAAKAAVWAPKANEAKRLAAELYAQIETLKAELVKVAGTHEENGEQKMNMDKLDASTALMEKDGKGKELYAKLQAFRKSIVGVLKPEDFADNPMFQAQLKKDIAAFDKSLPIDLKVPTSKSGNKYENTPEGWTLSNFHMTPAIAAMTILSKLQNDVKNSEAQIVDYCHNQIGSVKIVYDEFQAIAQANTTYAMPGDPIEITAGIGAFSAAAKPKVYVNGALQPLTAEGTALWKTNASGVGDHTVNVKIEYAKPDGTIVPVNKVVKYTVGMPSGASIFLQKMNVMYIGVENPLTISGGSVGREKVRVSFSNGEIKNTGGDNYSANPKTPGMGKVVVNADGKSYEFPIRVKFPPSPTPFVGAKKGGTISAAEFKAIGGIIAKLEDSEFELPYKVVSYRIGATGGPLNLYTEAANSGNRWTGNAAALVSRMGPGTTVFFDEIRVVGPDGRERSGIPTMMFKLK